MAGRGFFRHQDSQREIKSVFCKVTIGATGAPTLVSGERSQGVSSISRTSEGLYRVVLADKYVAFMGAQVTSLEADSMNGGWQVKAEDVDGASPYVDFEFQKYEAYGGLPKDPDNGAILYFKIEVRTVKFRGD